MQREKVLNFDTQQKGGQAKMNKLKSQKRHAQNLRKMIKTDNNTNSNTNIFQQVHDLHNENYEEYLEQEQKKKEKQELINEITKEVLKIISNQLK